MGQRWGGGFTACGLAAFAVVLAVLVGRSLQASDGTLVYVLDDPAIHLSLADNLVHHGTWGVVPGEFQSASSSPLWTLLVSGYQVLSPLPDSTGPLVLNVLAAVAVIVILGRHQRVLEPGARRPLDVVAVAALVTVPLFLPALALVGMEHTLHIALVLLAVALFQRRGTPGQWPRWLPYLVLAVAVATRLESTFVAAGIGLAVLLEGAEPLRQRVRTTTLVAVTALVPLAAISLWTRANGQGWLPNSVLAKAATSDTAADESGPIGAAYERLTADPMLVVLVLVALAVVAATTARLRPHRFGAVVLLVAAGLHVALARIGWYDRYQAYLIALGVYVALGAAGGLAPARTTKSRYLAGVLVVAASLLLCELKLTLTREVPIAVADTYGQRYQAGRFLGRYYDREPIATGELGYVSLLHDGPITDLYGLGDYEVLQERLATDNRPRAPYWEALAAERGFRVVAVYPRTLFLDTPEDWILVGTWRLDHDVVSAFEAEFQFWATTPEEVQPLIDHLVEFESELPDDTALELNELAPLRADQLREEG